MTTSPTVIELMGRCCGYFKREHNVKVISSLRHAASYANWYLHNVAPSRPSMKTTGASGALVARESSAYEKRKLDGKPSAVDDDEEPVDVAEAVVDGGMQALQLSEPPVVPKAPRRKVKTAVKKEAVAIVVDLDEIDTPAVSAGKDEDYASDSGDDFVQSDDDEFYDNLVVDWTIRSEAIKARLMARLKQKSKQTMAVATQ